MKRFRLGLLYTVVLGLAAPAIYAALPTTASLGKFTRTNSGYINTSLRTGIDPADAVVGIWQSVPAISIATGVTGSRSDRALFLSGVCASPTLSTTCTPTLAGNFTFGADGFVWTTSTAYSGLCHDIAACSGSTVLSNTFRVEAIAAPSADTTAGTVPTGLVCTNGAGQVSCSWDASSDVYEADGDVGSGISTYDVTHSVSGTVNVPGTAGLSKQLSATTVGTPGGSPTSTQTGADWQIVSRGDLDGVDDAALMRLTQIAGDFTQTVKVNTVSSSATFPKYGLVIRNGVATGDRMVFCGYQGNGATQWRRRTTDGASTGSIASVSSVTLPLWYRLTRSGSTETCEYSSDGNAFTALSSTTVAFDTTVYAGLVTTGDASNAGTGNFVQYSINNVARLSYAYNTASAGTISIRARDVAGNISAYGATVNVAPTVPADVTAPVISGQPSGASGGQTSINWTLGTWTDAGTIRGYIATTYTGSTCAAGTVTQAEQATNAYAQSGLSSNTAYSLKAQAVDNAGNVSALSSCVTVTTDSGAAPAFTAPATNACTGISTSVIQCIHGAVTGADHYITGYRADLNTGNWSVLNALDHTSLSNDFGGYTPNTQGCYRFAAVNADESITGPWSDGDCGTTLPVAGSAAVKWKPGHYPWIGGFLDLNSTSSMTAVLGIINNTICTNANLKGAQIVTYWTSLEQSQGVYTFTQLDRLVDALGACSKALMVHFKERTFGGAYSSNPTNAQLDDQYPAYLLTSTYGSTTNNSTTGNAGGVIYSPAGQSWTGSLKTMARVWNPTLMDRIIALTNALGARYDTNPAFLMFSIGETAIGAPSSSDFSGPAWYTQLKRLHSAMATSMPHTITRMNLNWVQGDDQMASLINYCLSLPNCIVGGPDPELPLPNVVGERNNTTQSGRCYRAGLIGGGCVNKTATGAWIGEVQDCGVTACGYTYTPAQIYTYYHGTMLARYHVWHYDNSQWPTTLSYINSISGASYTACPTNFPSCQ